MGNRIQYIAGVVFALAFIAIFAIMNFNIQGIANSVNNQLSRTYANTEMHELQAFNETTVTGATVVSAISNSETLYTYALDVIVDISGSEVTYNTSNPYSVTDPANANYINPTKSFTASLIRNANDIVTGIKFVQN